MVKTMSKKNEYPIGLFLHTRNETKEGIKYQGTVIGMDGDILFIQLFSWIMGEPTIVKTMSKSYIYSENCILYATQEDMLNEYEKNFAVKRTTKA
jgi:hypothetical protein